MCSFPPCPPPPRPDFAPIIINYRLLVRLGKQVEAAFTTPSTFHNRNNSLGLPEPPIPAGLVFHLTPHPPFVTGGNGVGGDFASPSLSYSPAPRGPSACLVCTAHTITDSCDFPYPFRPAPFVFSLRWSDRQTFFFFFF